MQTSEQITKRSASNLALAFILLPRAQRYAMSTLYAFCRHVDDIADDESLSPEVRAEDLARWREDVRKACVGGRPEFGINRELQPVIAEHRLPFNYFDDLIRGVESDLYQKRYSDFQQLDQYCYRVASVVGLLSIEIFGYRDPKCREYAVSLGKALQLTNILRDIGNDAARDRIYLPAIQLAQFGVTEAEIFQRRVSDRFTALCKDMTGRAKDHFRAAAHILPRGERRNMIAAELMGSVYWSLLCQLEKRNYPVLGDEPFRLTKGAKLRLVFMAWCRINLGLPLARYGI